MEGFVGLMAPPEDLGITPMQKPLFAVQSTKAITSMAGNSHSIDYWLWADLIAPESKRILKNVIRVHRQEDAHVFYIPFFTTISYFLLEKQQCKALHRVWVSI